MRFSTRSWLVMVLVMVFLAIPRVLFAQDPDGTQLNGRQILALLEQPAIMLLPSALFTLAARKWTWVAAWGDWTKRAVIVAGSVAVAMLIYLGKETLSAETVSSLLTAITGVLSGLTVVSVGRLSNATPGNS